MRKFLLIMSIVLAGSAMQAQELTEGEALMDKLYTQIISAYNSKNWETVNSLMQQLINAGADIDELEITYAESLAGSGQADKAVNRLKNYLNRNNDDFHAYQVLGDIYAQKGDTIEAIDAYQKSGELMPTFARPYVSLGRLVAKSDPKLAIDSYNKAIRTFLQSKRPDAAIQLGVEAMEIDNSNVQLLMYMGDALNLAGMDDKALSFYAEAITQGSRSESAADMEAVIDADYNISMIYYKQKQYAKAMDFLRSMLNSEGVISNLPQAYYSALCLSAACEDRLGNAKARDSYLEKAKTLEPEECDAFYQALLSLTE